MKKSDNSVKAVSSRILHKDSNTLTLTFACLLCILIAIMLIVLSALPTYVLDVFSSGENDGYAEVIEMIFALLLIALLFFVVVPLLTSYSCVAKKVSRGEKISFGDVFDVFFSFRLYAKSFGVFFIKLIRLLMIFMPMAGGVVFLLHFGNDGTFSAISPFEISALFVYAAFTVIAGMIVGVYLSSFLFFAPYLMLDGMKLRTAICTSVKMSSRENERINITRHVVSHTLSIIAAILSLGVLFVFYTAPRISVSYYVYCDSFIRSCND